MIKDIIKPYIYVLKRKMFGIRTFSPPNKNGGAFLQVKLNVLSHCLNGG